METTRQWLLIRNGNNDLQMYPIMKEDGSPLFQSKARHDYIEDCSRPYIHQVATHTVFDQDHHYVGNYVHDSSCPNCDSKFSLCWYYIDYQKKN